MGESVADLTWRQNPRLLLTETHSMHLGHPIHLPFGTQFGLELRDDRQHMEQQTATGVAGIDIRSSSCRSTCLPWSLLAIWHGYQVERASRASLVTTRVSPCLTYF